jgi:hypothetical protein
MIAALLALALISQVEARAEIEAPRNDAGALDLVVGSPFHLVVTSRHPQGEVALLPEPLELGSAVGERRSERRHDRSSEGDLEIDRYRLELVAFEPGDHTLPAIPLAFGSTQAATMPISIIVRSGLGEDEQLVAASTIAEAMAELEQMAAPNPSPRSIEVPDPRPIWAIAAAAALALAAIAGLAIRKRLGRKVIAGPPPRPPRPAHEVALERLEALRKGDHLARAEHKAFHVELSEILRGYAGARFGFDSIELTVAELFDELDRRSTPGLDRGRLRSILELSDFVKFAKLEPAIDESRAALEGALAIVRDTTPREEVQA